MSEHKDLKLRNYDIWFSCDYGGKAPIDNVLKHYNSYIDEDKHVIVISTGKRNLGLLRYIYNNARKFKSFGNFVDSTDSENMGFYQKTKFGFIRSHINYIDTGHSLNAALNTRFNRQIKLYLIKNLKDLDINSVLKVIANWFEESPEWKTIGDVNFRKEVNSIQMAETFFRNNEFKVLPSNQIEDFKYGIDFKVKRDKGVKTVQVKSAIPGEAKIESWKTYYRSLKVDYLVCINERKRNIMFINLERNTHSITKL